MLEDIHKIPWGRLRHAYGPAGDVPELILALRKADPPAPHDDTHPLHRLSVSICHQGSLYEATRSAVRFLVELAADEKVRCRADIMLLLSLIAGGEEGVAPWTRQKGKGQPADSPTEVAKGMAVYKRILSSDPDWKMRAAAAYLLASLRNGDKAAWPAIRAAIGREKHALTRAGMLLCLGKLVMPRPETIDLLNEAMQTDDRTQSAAAAYSLVVLAGPRAPRHAVDRMIEAADDLEFAKCFEGLPWPADLEMNMEELMRPLGRMAQTRRIALMHARIAHLEGMDAAVAVQQLLWLVFPPDWKLSRGLTKSQRLALQTALESDAFWNDGHGLLQYYGVLPQRRSELARLLRDAGGP
jgi:hypothetical protein